MVNIRPSVKFDVDNPEHRRWLGEFTLNRRWGNCPLRFTNNSAGNSIAQMQLKLLEYYVNQELTKA